MIIHNIEFELISADLGLTEATARPEIISPFKVARLPRSKTGAALSGLIKTGQPDKIEVRRLLESVLHDLI